MSCEIHAADRRDVFEQLLEHDDARPVANDVGVKGELEEATFGVRLLTERKRVEDDLRRANTDLEQFAYSASHDLQEPLRTLKIYSKLLLKSSVGAEGETAEYFGYLREAATRMEMLVRDLLAFTKVNRIEISSTETDAGDALSAALANLERAIAESNASRDFDKLPHVRIDRSHLQQVFQNLIGNAIKYRDPARRPEVHVSVQQRKGAWSFSVATTASASNPITRRRFLAYLQDFTEVTVIPARVSASRSVIASSSGIMAGSGSNPNPDKDRISASRSRSEETAARRPHILVIEDSKADAALIRKALGLASVSAQLQELDDGEKAIRFFERADADPQAACPDLILLDINMPRYKGGEILRRLRASPRCGHSLVLVVTSSDSDGDRKEMDNLGANGYFRKPSSFDEFMKLGQLVKELLAIGGNSSGPPA